MIVKRDRRRDRWESCPACSGFGYTRRDGSRYASARQSAQGRSSRTARRCDRCSGVGADRVASGVRYEHV